MEYYSAIKKNTVSPIEVNEPRAYHTELLSHKEKDKSGIFGICIWTLKRWN